VQCEQARIAEPPQYKRHTLFVPHTREQAPGAALGRPQQAQTIGREVFAPLFAGTKSGKEKSVDAHRRADALRGMTSE